MYNLHTAQARIWKAAYMEKPAHTNCLSDVETKTVNIKTFKHFSTLFF